MRKIKLYLDTSVLNFALTDKPELSLQKKATIDLLDAIKQGRLSQSRFLQRLIALLRRK